MAARPVFRLCAFCAAVVLCARAGAQPGSLEPLRTRASLDEAARQQIAQWVRQQADAVRQAVFDNQRIQALEALRQELSASQATPAFRQALAEAALTALPEAAGEAGGKSLAVLLGVVDLAARHAPVAAVIDAIEQGPPVLRVILAARLRARAQQRPIDEPPVLRRIAEAAAGETDPLVARDLVAALGGSANAGARFEALLAVLRARAERASREGPADVLADIEIARLIEPLTSGQITQAARVELARLLGQYLALLGRSYLGSDARYWPAEYREQVETAIVLLESALAAVVRTTGGGAQLPEAGEALRSGDTEGFREALGRWVGTAEQGGILNDPPWNLPRGGGTPGT